MRRFPDPRKVPWRYPRALFLYGQYLVYQRTNESRYLQCLKDWGNAHVDDNGNMFFDGGRTDPVDLSSWQDHLLPGRLMLILHRETGINKYKLAAQKLRQRFDVWPRTSDGGLWHRWEIPGQLSLDGTYMSLLFLVEYGQAFGDEAYAYDEATRQLLIYGNRLRDPATGLFYHGYDELREEPWADDQTGRSAEFWCRGIGWYGMALVGVLDRLPAGHPRRAELLGLLRGLAAGLEQPQDPRTKRWFEVMDKGSLPANWLETSCSSMHAYVLGRAASLGYVEPTYEEAASLGYQGVLDTISLGADGLTNLVEIVVGTHVGDLACYLAQPRVTNDWHGLGTFLIMHEQFNRRPPGSVLKWLEAERGTITAPMRVRASSTASAGAGIQAAAGSNSVAAPPNRGRARYSFQVGASGRYRIWGRAIAPTAQDDSFWIRVDGGPWRVWHGISLGSRWHWVDLETAAGSRLPLLADLAAGGHVLELAYREDGARLDRLLITDALGYTPGGLGG